MKSTIVKLLVFALVSLGGMRFLVEGHSKAALSRDRPGIRSDLDTFKNVVEPILQVSCIPCHQAHNAEGNIQIDSLNPDLVNGQDIDWWLEVFAVLNNGEMPPPDQIEMADEDRVKVVQWLSHELQLASKVRRDQQPHSTFRRMTRYEYNYALQDILGLPWSFAKDLPPDPTSEDGFKNSSEVLHMSVGQLETYHRLARKALQRATVIGDMPNVLYWSIPIADAAAREWPKQAAEIDKIKKQYEDDPEKLQQEVDRLTESFKAPPKRAYYKELSTGRTAPATWEYYGAKYAFLPQAKLPPIPETFDQVAIIPPGRNQNLVIELGDQIPDEGIMRVRVRASRTSLETTSVPSLQLEFAWRASNEGRAIIRVSDEDTPITASPDNPEFYQWDVPLGEIYPRNSVRNVSKMGDMPSPSEYIRFVNSSATGGDIQIDYVEVATPVNDQWPPTSHQQIFFDSDNKQDELAYAREILQRFMAKAWRRDITFEEVNSKLKLFERVRPSCSHFEEAVVEVLAAVLTSPQLLYVTKVNPAEDGAAQQQLTPHELATRLSLFLWCSIPDEQLLQLADQGTLCQQEILSQQVDRMLMDKRARRFSEQFVFQWLDMELLEFLDISQSHRNFDPLLKEAMQQEPIEFFQSILDTDKSLLNFIDSDYAMVNERLAQHYGLSGVRGNHFRPANLEPANNRGGLLTQAGLMAMNSAGTDSHPLKRGVWLLESILNDPPPPPPPAVPEIDLADPEVAKMTLKQRIEDHRNHAACMSCHSKIDPWGIAFENYDAVGRWRSDINGSPVDATSMLFNKHKLDGMEGLKKYLLENRQDQFVRALVCKLSTFALGRPLTFADRSAIDEITAEVRARGDGLATTILVITSSRLFRSH